MTSATALYPDEVQGYCKAPFRMPSANELQTIVEYATPHGEVMLDSDAFSGSPIDDYWTSSPCPDAHDVYMVSFFNGTAGCGPSPHIARCVR